MGSELKLAVLGDFRVFRDSQTVPLPPSKKTRVLFAYLAVIQRPQRREPLCEMFWEIPDDPRGALRWSLPKQSGPDFASVFADLVPKRAICRSNFQPDWSW
jgi:hypothetical protein